MMANGIVIFFRSRIRENLPKQTSLVYKYNIISASIIYICQLYYYMCNMNNRYGYIIGMARFSSRCMFVIYIYDLYVYV